MPFHIGKGRTVSTAIADIIDYVENPQKTDNGRLITGYECDTRTADAEFTLSKREYLKLTGLQRGKDDVITYHLRQAFLPGEVTPETANQIGRELAMKLTKGNSLHPYRPAPRPQSYHFQLCQSQLHAEIPQLLEFDLGDSQDE